MSVTKEPQGPEPSKEQLEAEVARRVAEIRNTLHPTVQAIISQRSHFEDALYRQWAPALDIFEIVINMSRTVGVTMYNKHRECAKQENDHLFLALASIQARACVAAGGVFALLRSGYAQDAFARWRTMFELGCVAMFIRKHGQDAAERYLLHDAIESLSLAEQIQKYHAKFGETHYSEDAMRDLLKRKDELVERFGNDFAKPYGWAASALQSRRPTFDKIEESVGLENIRHYYKIASYGVHSDYKGSSFNISLPTSIRIQLYGQSGYGLSDAGDGALEMLGLCTVLFISKRPSWEVGITMRVLHALARDGREAFHKIHEQAAKHSERDQST